MASADYKLCDMCGAKTFYDADIDCPHYETSYAPERHPQYKPILVMALCGSCAETHTLVIQPRNASDAE